MLTCRSPLRREVRLLESALDVGLEHLEPVSRCELESVERDARRPVRETVLDVDPATDRKILLEREGKQDRRQG
jgi:hypothetical protein